MALTPLAFVVVVLASFRSTRFVTADSLTDSIRYRALHGGPRWVSDLIGCPFCIGFWLSAIAYLVAVVALHRFADVGVLVHLVSIWGVAGGQSLVSAVDGLLNAGSHG